MPRLRIAIFCFCAALCVALLAPAQLGWCAEAKERYIKKLGVSEGYINLEVDGEKVRIPLPEGYEEFSKEDYPDKYEFFYGPKWSSMNLTLCGLVSTEDNIARKNDYLSPARFAFIEIPNEYIPHRLSEYEFKNEMSYLKKYRNEETKKKSRFSFKYLIENNTTLMELRVEKKFSPENNSIAYTETNYLYKKIIISFRFYTSSAIDDSINILLKNTKDYLKLLAEF